VRHTAIGVNYIDTYHRSGVYKVAFPSGIGMEAAGIVEAVGQGVDVVAPGDRVAYCNGPLGAYSEARVMPADRLVKLPADVADRVAATLMLKGLTVQYLFRQTASSRRATRSCSTQPRAASASSRANGRARWVSP
jgi:NADPH2:quinone reductase